MNCTKFDKKNNVQSAFVLMLTGMMISGPAFAALTVGNTMLEEVKAWLLGIAAVTVTIAIMFVGFRMMFQAAQWKDVAPVFWGGVLIGSASAIAAVLVG